MTTKKPSVKKKVKIYKPDCLGSNCNKKADKKHRSEVPYRVGFTTKTTGLPTQTHEQLERNNRFADKDFSRFAPKLNYKKDTNKFNWLELFKGLSIFALVLTFIWIVLASAAHRDNIRNQYWDKQLASCKAIGGTLTVDGCN